MDIERLAWGLSGGIGEVEAFFDQTAPRAFSFWADVFFSVPPRSRVCIGPPKKATAPSVQFRLPPTLCAVWRWFSPSRARVGSVFRVLVKFVIQWSLF